MSKESLRPGKKYKGRGRSRLWGYKCEVMERETVTGAVHTVSVLACGCARAGVFTHLSKNVEERGWGSVKMGHTRGFVTLCGGDTSEALLAPTVDSQCLP